MEDQAGWHGESPKREELNNGLQELGLTGRIPVQLLLDKSEPVPGGGGKNTRRKNAEVLPQLLVECR